MGERIALCIDETTCLNPALMGLDGELLDSQGWLRVFVNGEEARQGICKDGGFEEAWVASSEDVEPINLAATIKEDRPDLPVRLVVAQGCGSLLSRAHTAGIDEVLELQAFAALYADTKARLGRGAQEGARIAEKAQGPVIAGTDDDPSPVAFDAVATELAVSKPPARPKTAVATKSHGFVMPVVSGSGGAGKSSVSVMAALIAREMGYRTLLLDYDLQFGDMPIMVGAKDPLAIDEALSHPELLEREMRKDPAFTLIAAPDRLEKAESVVRGMPAFLDDVAPLFDVIIANTGAAWAEQHAVLLERSYTALFLIDQRTSSIHACKRALELCARCGIATGPFEFAINRCAKGAPLTAADVSSAFQGAPVFELKDGGRDVEDFLAAGGAPDLLRSGNEFCESLGQVMARLLPKGGQSLQGGAFGVSFQPAPKRKGFVMGRKRGRKNGDS